MAAPALKPPTEPNTAEYNGTVPLINIAGKQWPIPELAIKHLRLVVPAIMKVMPRLAMIKDRVKKPDEMILALMGIDIPIMDALLDAIFWSMHSGTPALLREEFDSMRIPARDLLGSIDIVVQQTGMFVKAPAVGTEPVGEDLAGSPSQSNGAEPSAGS